MVCILNPLNTELKPSCHLLALIGAHHILHVSRVRIKGQDVIDRLFRNVGKQLQCTLGKNPEERIPRR